MTSPVEYVASALSITASAIKTVKGVYEFLDRVRQIDIEIDSLTTTVQVWTEILEGINSSLNQKRRSQQLSAKERRYLDCMGKVIRMCEKDVQLLQAKLPSAVPNTSRWKIKGRDSSWRENTVAAVKLYIKEDRRLIERIAGHMQLLSHLNFISPGEMIGGPLPDQIRERLGRLPQKVSENDTRPSSRATSPSARTDNEIDEEKVITDFEDATYDYTTDLVTRGHNGPDLVASMRRGSIITTPQDNNGVEVDASTGITLQEMHIRFKANQAIVNYLFDKVGLPGNAYRVQKRGIEIRKIMAERYRVSLDFDTYAQLQLRLVHILLACNVPERKKEAYEILKSLDETSWNDRRTQRSEIRLSLAQLCSELQQTDEARRLLNALYAEFKEAPSSNQEQLQKVIELMDQVHRETGNLEDSAAWREIVEDDVGAEFLPSHNLSRALEWCQSRGFDVSEVRQRVPFDHIRNQNGDSPLHDAARHPEISIGILEDLLSRTHSLDGRDKRGNTVLMIAAEQSGDNAVQAMEVFLAHSSPEDLTARGGDEDETPLHRCRDFRIARLLLQRVARRGSYLSTDSVETGAGDSVTLNAILNNQEGYYRKTPLHTACQYARTDVVKVLLAYGADPSLQDAGSQIPRQRLPSSTKRKDRFLIIEWMLGAYVSAGKSDSEKKILLDDPYLSKADRKVLLSKPPRLLTLEGTPRLSNVSFYGPSSRRSSSTTAFTSSSSRSGTKSSTEAPRLSIAIEPAEIQFRFQAEKEDEFGKIDKE